MDKGLLNAALEAIFGATLVWMGAQDHLLESLVQVLVRRIPVDGWPETIKPSNLQQNCDEGPLGQQPR